MVLGQSFNKTNADVNGETFVVGQGMKMEEMKSNFFKVTCLIVYLVVSHGPK